jgi:nucleoside-diphosphate-sugar epimerase
MSRIVVAGGAGFLGSHLCDFLIARGDSVTLAVSELGWKPTTELRDGLAATIAYLAPRVGRA